jgi:hypothetical protein
MNSDDYTTRFHLHRRFDFAPYRRYAFTVEFSEEADAGYVIVDHDPIVANPSYLAKFAEFMQTPMIGVRSALTGISDEAPGSIAHFTTAVRKFGAAVMPHGRGA